MDEELEKRIRDASEADLPALLCEAMGTPADRRRRVRGAIRTAIRFFGLHRTAGEAIAYFRDRAAIGERPNGAGFAVWLCELMNH